MSRKTHAMSKYKPITEPKKPEHSFTKNGVYLNYGIVKTYANKTQCQVRIALLKSLGYDCYMSYDWPFIILKSDHTLKKC